MAVTPTTSKHGRPTGVHFDISGFGQVSESVRELLDDRIPWFQERAISTLGRRLPVEARRDIQAEYNISAGRVRDHLYARVVRAENSPRAGGIRLVGQWKRGVGLAQFSARWRRKWAGVRYRVYHGRNAEEAGAFLTRLKSGNLHAVQRHGPKTFDRTYTDRKGKSRTRKDQRLQVLYRSSIAQMLAKGRRPERLLDYSRNLLSADVQRQVNGYLKRPTRTR